MRYYIDELEQEGKSTRKWIPNGEAGNLVAMLEMRRIARSYLGLDNQLFDNQLYELAQKILSDANVATHDKAGQLNAIHEWVIKNVRYVNDPQGGNQILELPHYILQEKDNMHAACSGLTLLEGVLLGMVGFLFGFEAANYHAGEDGYEHVYAYVVEHDNIIYADPTAYNQPLGWRSPEAVEVARILVNNDDKHGQFELEGFFDFLGTVADVVGGAFGIPAAGAPLHMIGKKKDAEAQQERQQHVQLDQLALQVEDYYKTLSAQVASGQGVTTDELNKAQTDYDNLDNLFQQYNPQKWQDPSYQAAYLHDLDLFKQHVIDNTQASAGASTQPLTGATAQLSNSLGVSPAVVEGGLLFVAFLALKGLFR